MANDKWTKRNGYLSLAGIKFWRANWDTAIRYVAGDGIHSLSTGNAYICILEHTADAAKEPGVGADWEDYWNILVEGGNGNVFINVSQAAHGLVLGDYVRQDTANPNAYVPAVASSFLNSQGVGFVVDVADEDHFTLVQTGYVKNAPGAVPSFAEGTALYLSPTTPGGVTSTMPNTIGQYIKPVAIITEDGESMWVLSDFPYAVGAGGGGVQSVSDDGKGIVNVNNSDPNNPVVEFDEVALANYVPFIDAIIANTYFTEELANNANFINELTQNTTFQNEVNNFVTGGGSGGSGGSSKLAQDMTAFTSSGTSLQTAYTIPIPGGTLGENNSIRLTLLRARASNGGAASEFDVYVKYGGQTVAQLAFDSGAFSGSNKWFSVDSTISADGVTGQASTTKGSFTINPPAGESQDIVVGGLTTIDSAANQDLTIEVQPASGSTIVNIEGILVEKITNESIAVSADALMSMLPLGKHFDDYSGTDVGKFVLNNVFRNITTNRIYAALSQGTSYSDENQHLRIFRNEFGSYYQENEISISPSILTDTNGVIANVTWNCDENYLYAMVRYVKTTVTTFNRIDIVRFDLDGTNPVATNIFAQSPTVLNTQQYIGWEDQPNGDYIAFTIHGTSLFTTWSVRTGSSSYTNQLREYTISGTTYTLANTYTLTGGVNDIEKAFNLSYDPTDDCFLFGGERAEDDRGIDKYVISGSNITFDSYNQYPDFGYGNNRGDQNEGFNISRVQDKNTYNEVLVVQEEIVNTGGNNDRTTSFRLFIYKMPKF